MRNKLLKILLLTVLSCTTVFAQQGKKGRVKVISPIERVSFTKIDGKRVRILVGNVAFQKDSVIFTCDSAIQYTDDAVIYAYKNVSFNQGDSLKLTGDELIYDEKNGNAEIKGELVRMTDGSMTLRTTRLFFDEVNHVAYYVDSAYIEDAENKLHSIKGYYYTQTRDMYFKKRVRLINPEYNVKTDTLRYNVISENSYFYGPSHITTKDDEYLYCERGTFLTKSGIVRLGKNSKLLSATQELWGDSLFYNSKTGKGIAYKRARMLDTAQKMQVEGNYATYNRIDDAFMVTDSAVLTQFDGGDSVFIAADTLRIFYDSLRENRIALAYYHVRMYNKAYQAVCDSLFYHSGDSVMHYNGSPVFWMEDYQVSAAFIRMTLSPEGIDSVYLESKAMMCMQHDDDRFDQMGGDSMEVSFRQGNINRVRVHGSAKAIYYILDEDSAHVGTNKISAAWATIKFGKKGVERLKFAVHPGAEMIPAKEAKPKELRLEGFLWRGKEKPLSPADLFRRIAIPETSANQSDSALKEE